MLDPIFNYAEYLKRHCFAGQVHPTFKNEQNDHPMIALLVPVDTALAEIIGWSGQDITRSEFLKYLKKHDIQVFNTVDDFVKAKIEYNRRNIVVDTTRLQEIADTLNVSKNRIGYDVEINRTTISGKNGYIHEDSVNPSIIHVYVKGRTKRHWSSVKQQLSFARLLKEEDTSGLFILDTNPNEEEARIVRKLIGVSKRPTITLERKEALKSHMKSIRTEN